MVLEKISDTQLSPAFLELIKNLWDKNGPKSFSPNNFINTVEKMNPLFKKGQDGDSKDFIIFILEQLHKELKKPSNYKDINPNQLLNQYDKNNAFNYFFNDFRKECSVISDLFFGFTEMLYRISFLDLLKLQMNAFFAKIFIILKDEIIQYVIIMVYLIA